MTEVTFAPADRPALAKKVRQAVTSSRVFDRRSTQERAQFEEEAVGGINAYLTGDFDAYRQLRAEADVPYVDANAARDDWEAGCRSIHSALIGSDLPTVTVLVKDGERLANPKGVVGTFEIYNVIGGGNKARGPGDVANPIEARTDVVEVSIPARLTVQLPSGKLSEETFSGKLGVTLTRRPTDGRWIITGVRVSGIPNGASVSIPMI